LHALVSDFSFNLGDFSLQGGDFSFGDGDGGGGDVDSSLVLVDFGGAFSFLFAVDSVGLLLLDN
jgi:hypothetical protein